jgi:hypothetical protein
MDIVSFNISGAEFAFLTLSVIRRSAFSFRTRRQKQNDAKLYAYGTTILFLQKHMFR